MMNQWNAVGRVSQATYKKTATSSFVKFTLAIQRPRGKNETEAKTDFIPCGIFGKPAEFFNNYIEKGDMISVTGSMQLNTYEKNGQQITTIECYVTQINIVNKYNPANKSQTQQLQAAPQPQPQQAPPTPPPVYGQTWTPPVQHCTPAPQPDTWEPLDSVPFDIYGGGFQ